MIYSINRIMLADDDEDDRMIFKQALNEVHPHAELLTAVDGEVLMTALADNANPLPQLIFLDLNMPCKSGMECLQEIRANSMYNAIPVIIYSTSANVFDKEKAKSLGANLYIQKALYPQLISTLTSILSSNDSLLRMPLA